MKYGKLTFVRDAAPRHGKPYCVWQCDCGRVKEIKRTDVRNGRARSCGCESKKAMREAIGLHFAAFKIDRKNKGVA